MDGLEIRNITQDILYDLKNMIEAVKNAKGIYVEKGIGKLAACDNWVRRLSRQVEKLTSILNKCDIYNYKKDILAISGDLMKGYDNPFGDTIYGKQIEKSFKTIWEKDKQLKNLFSQN